jgi:hypothetical protein
MAINHVRLMPETRGQISPEDVSVDLVIDGQLVERRRRLKSGIIYRLGRLQKKKHSTKHHQSQARLFDSSILQQSNKTGTVHANFYSALEQDKRYDGTEDDHCNNTNDNEGDDFVIVEENEADGDYIAVIPSCTQETKERRNVALSALSPPGMLASMTMNYCSTEHLYHQGILPRRMGYNEIQNDCNATTRKLRIDHVVAGQIVDTKEVSGFLATSGLPSYFETTVATPRNSGQGDYFVVH